MANVKSVSMFIVYIFRYELIEPPDKKWGSFDSNLTFNGMIGQLQREVIMFFKCLYIEWAASSENSAFEHAQNVRVHIILSCACSKYHPSLCFSFIYSVVSNDSVSGLIRLRGQVG